MNNFTVENTFQGIRISTMHKGYRVSMHYIGYTKKEAVLEFKQYLKTI